MGQTKGTALVEMALETRLGRFPGIDDGPGGAARTDVNTRCAVAGFAAHVGGVLAKRLEPGVIRARKVLRLVSVTLSAALRSHELCSRDFGWSQNGSRRRPARDGRHQDDRQAEKGQKGDSL